MEKNYPNSWSELPSDILNSVFERLGFADFQQGKSVCSSWYAASRQCVPKNQIPWLILFPKYKSNINSCTLFNPEVKDKLYKTQDLGCDFSESKCRATYGSWLLMQDPLYSLYILNIFTKERIDLPSIESQLGMIKIERISDTMFQISKEDKLRGRGRISIRCPVFWIDEKTKDYIVIWGLRKYCLLYTKKGDDLWKQIHEIRDYLDLVYKDHKLYYSSLENSFGIFDFSGEVPQQTFCGVLPRNGPRRDPHNPVVIIFTKLVVKPIGDVLKVVRRFSRSTGVSSFNVYKVYSSGSLMYERVYSLGNEAMLFDLGITVLANDNEGLKKNSIYFNIGSHVRNPTEICLFNLQTRKREPLHEFDSSSLQLSTA